jgi:hypothetical protein
MNRFLAIFGIVVLVLIAAFVAVGWITFHKSPEKATVEIHTQQMEQAGEKAVDSSRKLIEEAADSVKKAVHEERDKSTTHETGATSPVSSATTPD